MSAPATESLQPATLPESVSTKIASVQSRRRRIALLTAAICAVAALAVTALAAIATDWISPLYTHAARVSLTLATVAAAVITFVLVLRRLRPRRGNVDLARQIDHSVDGLDERFTTLTELSRSSAPAATLGSPSLIRQVAREADQRANDVQPAEVATARPARFASAILALPLLVGVVVSIIDAGRFTHHLARYLAPFADLTRTKIDTAATPLITARGEPLDLSASVGGDIPQVATVELRNPDGSVTSYPSRISRATLAHRVPDVEVPVEYRITAGDARTSWIVVGVADRPAYASVSLTVTPPAYTKLPTENHDGLPPRIRAVEGSRLDLVFTTASPDTTADLESTQLAPGEDGVYTHTVDLTTSLTLAPVLTSPLGLTNKPRPSCSVIVFRDLPPAVELAPGSDKIAFNEDDEINIAFKASDDFGIDSAELLVTTQKPGEQPVTRAIPIQLGDQRGAQDIDQAVSLDLSELGLSPDTELSYAVRVTDTKSGATDASQLAGNDSQEGQNNAGKPGEPGQPGKSPPPDNMTKRMLDVPGQSTASVEQDVRIGDYIGDFEGEPRDKTELALRPVITSLRAHLVAAGTNVQSASKKTDDLHLNEARTELATAATHLEDGGADVDELLSKSNGTPYAFMGQQLENIRHQHLRPAQARVAELQKASSLPLPEDPAAWADFHIRRAIEKLDELTKTFSEVEQKLLAADILNDVTDMHRLFVEDLLEMMGEKPGALHAVNGKMGEADEAYIKAMEEYYERMKEVMEKLAKLLEEDPKLRARFIEMQKLHAHNIRDQFTLLTEDQKQVAAAFKTWSTSPDASAASRALIDRYLAAQKQIAADAAELKEKSEIWIPDDLDDPNGVAARYLEGVAALAHKLHQIAHDPDAPLPDLALVDEMRRLRTIIPSPGPAFGNAADLATYAKKRRENFDALIAAQTAVLERITAAGEGDLHQATASEQLEVTDKTALYNTRFISAIRQVGTFSADAKTYADTLINILTTDIPDNQAEVDAFLGVQDTDNTADAFDATTDAFDQANEQFDLLVVAVAEATGPCACTPQAMTLEQLLALLSQEQDPKIDFANILHQMNLQIISDWQKQGQPSPGQAAPGSTPQQRALAEAMALKNAREAAQQARQVMREARQQQQAANERARAIAEHHAGKINLGPATDAPGTTAEDWNTLPSQLEDDLLQARDAPRPPRYQKAIEDYFRTVSE